MKPELPSSIPRPEQRSDLRAHNVEQITSIKGAEINDDNQVEQRGREQNVVVAREDVMSASVPSSPSQVVVDDVNNTSLSSPVVAADEDLIEKEWVDKAKKIINDNKSDPYKQEEAISNLRYDYINKRYGRDRRAA